MVTATQQPLTQEQVMEQFERLGYLNTRHREIIPDARTAVVAGRDGIGFRPTSGARLIELEPETGIKTLGDFLKIPWPIDNEGAKGITANTFANVATDRLGRQKKFTFVTRDGKLVGWTVTKDPIIEPERVIETIGKVYPDAAYDNVFNLDNYKVSLDLFTPSITRTADTRVGDLARAGATVLFSPYGTVAPSVQAYTNTLICLNGAMHSDFIGEFAFTGNGHGGGDNSGDYWRWLKAALKKAANAIGGITDRWHSLVNENIPEGERAHVIAGIIKDAKLPPEVAAAIWAKVADEPVENAYDAMQLITWAASHTMTDPRMVMRARRFADGFSRERGHSRACPMCHRRETELTAPETTQAG